MMQENWLLEMVVCPCTGLTLRNAEDPLIQRINRAIAAGHVTNVAGRRVEGAIDGGLVRSDGQILYPIAHAIPILVAEEGITLDLLEP
jgi:uncharacterized protein YbaR (Trm112 family)